jgi:hypothetical protein
MLHTLLTLAKEKTWSFLNQSITTYIVAAAPLEYWYRGGKTKNIDLRQVYISPR